MFDVTHESCDLYGSVVLFSFFCSSTCQTNSHKSCLGRKTNEKSLKSQHPLIFSYKKWSTCKVFITMIISFGLNRLSRVELVHFHKYWYLMYKSWRVWRILHMGGLQAGTGAWEWNFLINSPCPKLQQLKFCSKQQ